MEMVWNDLCVYDMMLNGYNGYFDRQLNNKHLILYSNYIWANQKKWCVMKNENNSNNEIKNTQTHR